MRKAACRPEVEQTCHESDQKLQIVTIIIEHQTASKLPLMIFFQSASKPGRILLQELVSCYCGNINDVHVISYCNHTCFPTLATNLLHVPVHDYMPLLQPPLQHEKKQPWTEIIAEARSASSSWSSRDVVMVPALRVKRYPFLGMEQKILKSMDLQKSCQPFLEFVGSCKVSCKVEVLPYSKKYL